MPEETDIYLHAPSWIFALFNSDWLRRGSCLKSLLHMQRSLGNLIVLRRGEPCVSSTRGSGRQLERGWTNIRQCADWVHDYPPQGPCPAQPQCWQHHIGCLGEGGPSWPDMERGWLCWGALGQHLLSVIIWPWNRTWPTTSSFIRWYRNETAAKHFDFSL